MFVFCVNLEIPATQQLIFLTSEVLPSLLVKNVVRISPPLNNSWHRNTCHHHHSFLVPVLLPTGVPTSERWCLNSALLASLLLWSEILRLLIIESPFRRWSCNPAHISGAPFNQCLIVYVFLEHTSLYHLSWQMSSSCSHYRGNPSVWNPRWIVTEPISHLLIPSLV